MVTFNSFNNSELHARPELIEMMLAVSKEKNLSFDEVVSVMEAAVKKIALNRYGSAYDIRVDINKNNGAITIKRCFTVVENVENESTEILITQAKLANADVVLGDEVVEYLPQVDFDRSNVQGFRQSVVMKLREIERAKEYEAYKDKVGEIVSGVVRRVEFGNVFVELTNKAEAFLSKDNCIPREYLEVGSRIRALIIDVKKDNKVAQISLSRSSAIFIEKLLAQEVSEVYEGLIQVHAIAREAGSRCKIALSSSDPSIDPVGTVVGFKGSRIHGVLGELKGEKIDLVRWSDNIANFVINAFHPHEVVKVVVDQDKKSIEVVVKNESLSLAIGRGGQNINLISKLVGWHIDLMGEDAEKESRQKAFNAKLEIFKEALDVDDVIAQLLAIENVSSVEDIANEKVNLTNIPGFNEDIIAELTNRAKEYLEEKQNKIQTQLTELGVSSNLQQMLENNLELLLLIAKQGVLTVDDLADLSTFELKDMLPANFANNKTLEEIIVKARGL